MTMAIDAAELCPGEVCDGSGLVPGPPRCPSTCTPLRHGDGCPVRRPAPCPACEQAALGEDLQWSAAS